MVKIRLRRMGSAKTPFYRIVAADSRRAVSGSFIEILGYYDPLRKPLEMKVDEGKVFKWLGNGAQLSDTMRSLLRKSGTMAKWNRILQGEEGVVPETVFIKGASRNSE